MVGVVTPVLRMHWKGERGRPCTIRSWIEPGNEFERNAALATNEEHPYEGQVRSVANPPGRHSPVTVTDEPAVTVVVEHL